MQIPVRLGCRDLSSLLRRNLLPPITLKCTQYLCEKCPSTHLRSRVVRNHEILLVSVIACLDMEATPKYMCHVDGQHRQCMKIITLYIERFLG